jgi:hypothetical protein
MHARAQVNVTTDPDMGTIYSVAVPIKRVKPTARVPLGGAHTSACSGSTKTCIEWMT